MASETSRKIIKEVRPILSLDRCDAKRRVISLYKAWYRQIPMIVKLYDIEFSEAKCKKKLREEFTKHCNIKDVRIIDMLVIRCESDLRVVKGLIKFFGPQGRMDLQETSEYWTTRRGVARFFDKTADPKPDCFLAKFLSGKD